VVAARTARLLAAHRIVVGAQVGGLHRHHPAVAVQATALGGRANVGILLRDTWSHQRRVGAAAAATAAARNPNPADADATTADQTNVNDADAAHAPNGPGAVCPS